MTKPQYERYNTFNINFILDRLSEFDFSRDEYRNRNEITIAGIPIRISQRYECFVKSQSCVTCGLIASHFAIEKDWGGHRYHMNMYGNENGREILFTKDHIIPKSKGGKNIMSNYQVMCAPCNIQKGSSL